MAAEEVETDKIKWNSACMWNKNSKILFRATIWSVAPQPWLIKIDTVNVQRNVLWTTGVCLTCSVILIPDCCLFCYWLGKFSNRQWATDLFSCICCLTQMTCYYWTWITEFGEQAVTVFKTRLVVNLKTLLMRLTTSWNRQHILHCGRYSCKFVHDELVGKSWAQQKTFKHLACLYVTDLCCQWGMCMKPASLGSRWHPPRCRPGSHPPRPRPGAGSRSNTAGSQSW